eukprot:Platyproteum_vivax@DN5121_c0_g1_i3.p4
MVTFAEELSHLLAALCENNEPIEDDADPAELADHPQLKRSKQDSSQEATQVPVDLTAADVEEDDDEQDEEEEEEVEEEEDGAVEEVEEEEDGAVEEEEQEEGGAESEPEEQQGPTEDGAVEEDVGEKTTM